LKALIVGDDFTPYRLFEEHLRKRVNAIALDITGFDLTPNSPTPPNLPNIREYFGDPKTVIEKAKGADVLAITFAPITKTVIDSIENLKLIACARGGPINVDVQYATEKKIPVVYTPGRNADAVADYAMGLIICLGRSILAADKHVRSGEWKTPREDTFEKPTGIELRGRTLGIIGIGQVGSRICRRAKAFGLNILVYDPFVKETEEKSVDLDTLLHESDIVTVHARVKTGSPPLISAREFHLMKSHAFIINTSRATAVDEDALYDVLAAKQIAGAALDVYRQEPLPSNSKLLKLENLILTPHAAGVSLDIPTTTCEMISQEIALFLSGKPPLNIINPEAITKG
jgi:D-3-phosphoglycerate dehydrogenase